MIDTHCHLTFDQLHRRIDQILADADTAGVDRMISVGTTPADATRALAIAHRFPRVYATAGVHPHYAAEFSDKAALRDSLNDKLADPRCVALGEMGLDRHYPDPPIDDQRRVFAWQLELMQAPGSPANALPGIIHNREATDETLAMIREAGIPGERFVFHCFTGSADELDAILELGAKVSFTGIVTFPSASNLAQASDRVPLDRLMIETDSPYLTPEPNRRVKPNEPRYVADVARFLAQRRGLDLDTFVKQVDTNAVAFFNLPSQGNP
ncbi:MAG: TatD family hydrolase [Phycisphaerales bacterium JB063]